MKTPLLVPFAALAMALAVAGPPVADAAAAPSPSPAVSKDPCASSKSKWAHAQCEAFTHSAPGDEYFGRMKMSYLGIDNTFKDGTISAGTYTTDSRLINKLVLADDALARWAAKYPGDPQLARSYYLGVIVFRKVYTQQGQDLAWRYMQLLLHKYPNTYFGKQIAAALAKDGFTEHWFAAAQACPATVAKATPTPTPTPSPTPAPNKPNVEVLDPPCVQPSLPPAGAATPTPSPTPKH